MNFAEECRKLKQQNSSIVTFTGKRYFPFTPSVDHVDIIDIAHSLAHQCRYGGHSDFFWSVAEHSVMTSHMVPERYALEALLHDAAEAYCHDIATPVKRFLPDYMNMIQENERIIRRAFALPMKESAVVMFVDALIGKQERVMITKHWLNPEHRAVEVASIRRMWDLYIKDTKSKLHFPEVFPCSEPAWAKERFLHRFRELTR